MVVEVRCSRRGSSASSRNESADEHHCPICRRPVKADEGFVCDECGTGYLCDSCVEEIGGRFLCKRCIKDKGWNCNYCDNKYEVWCQNCGTKCCKIHTDKFDFIPKSAFDELNKLYHSLYCPTCKSYICNKCYVEIKRTLRGTAEYCKKCGTKLLRKAPLHESHLEHWKQVLTRNK